jgi:hypothetical protein
LYRARKKVRLLLQTTLTLYLRIRSRGSSHPATTASASWPDNLSRRDSRHQPSTAHAPAVAHPQRVGALAGR